MKRIRNTLARALRGLPPKYRGARHATAHAHATSVARGEWSPCAAYYHGEPLPVEAIVTPWGHGVLGYVCPYGVQS